MATTNKPDILETIRREGFEPKRKSRAYWLSCPFHEDRTPSLKIDPEHQTFYCFGCNEGGDVITFIQKLHRLSFQQSLAYLRITRNHPPILDPKDRTKKDLVKAFHDWERDYYRWLTCFCRAFNDAKKTFKTIDDVCEFIMVQDRMPLVEHYMDILSYGSDEERYELYAEGRDNGGI